MQKETSFPWKGSIFIKRRRIVYVGAAGTSIDQAIHGVKICVALNGEFELSADSEIKGKQYAAAIINAGIKHTVRCNGAKIFLAYFLPETEVARQLRREYMNNGTSGVYEVAKKFVKDLLPLQEVIDSYSDWSCKEAFETCDKLIEKLGDIRGKKLSTSTELSKKLGPQVIQIINHVYDDMAVPIGDKDYNDKMFVPSVIAKVLDLKVEQVAKLVEVVKGNKVVDQKVKWVESDKPDKVAQLKRRFKEDTGISIEHFTDDIQLLLALEQYAIEKEKDPEARLKDSAGSVGFRNTGNFPHRARSRLGITLIDLRKSWFFRCEKDASEG